MTSVLTHLAAFTVGIYGGAFLLGALSTLSEKRKGTR